MMEMDKAQGREGTGLTDAFVNRYPVGAPVPDGVFAYCRELILLAHSNLTFAARPWSGTEYGKRREEAETSLANIALILAPPVGSATRECPLYLANTFLFTLIFRL